MRPHLSDPLRPGALTAGLCALTASGLGGAKGSHRNLRTFSEALMSVRRSPAPPGCGRSRDDALFDVTLIDKSARP